MSNKYASRTIHSVKLNSFCEICGDKCDNNDRQLLICTICSNKSHLNCESLTSNEYQVLCNPTKHPNIYWKCANCSWPNNQQISNLENLVELMYSQLKELHSKVDFLCKNQHHNQGKLLINQGNFTPSNQLKYNQQTQIFSNSRDLPLYPNNNNLNYANTQTQRWNTIPSNKFLSNIPASAINTNLNDLLINHFESSTSPFYASNTNPGELINEEFNKIRDIDLAHLPSQTVANLHLTKDQIIKNSAKNNLILQPPHYQIKNQSIDLINSNKFLIDRSQNKIQSCDTTNYDQSNSQSISLVPKNDLQQSLYSPTQMLNHFPRQQSQLETLTEMYDVQIPPPDVPNKEYLLCVLSHIESPSEFYVHVTDESTSNPVDDISEQLANCYSGKQQYPVALPENLIDLKGKFFAALYSSDDNYYRVRVLDVFDNEKLLVQYVDYGNTETVTIDKLNYLKSELADMPILAVKCSLSHIKPVEKIWTVEHNYFFKNISGYDQEKIVTAYITNRPDVIDYDSIIEVFLWNNDVQLDGLRLDGSKDILINSLMVEIGLANSLFEDNYEWVEEAEKISRECGNELTPTDHGIKILTTLETRTSETNLNNNLTKDSEMNQNNQITSNTTGDTLNPTTFAAAVNQSFESECSFDTETLDESRTYTDQILSDNITNYETNTLIENSAINNTISTDKNLNFSINDTKQKEKIEEFLTKSLSGVEIQWKEEELEMQRKPYPLDDLLPGTCVFLKITFIHTPNFFYGVLPFASNSYDKINVYTAKQLMEKLKSAPEFLKYKEMNNKMKAYYSKADIKDQYKIVPKIGWLVVAKKAQDFFRARVVQANIDNTVFQVQCIDTGKVSSINRSNLFRLKREFYELAEFAVQYSMPNIEPFNCNLVNQRKCAWSEAAKKAFMDYTLGNVHIARILEVVKCGTSSINGNTNKCEKVLVDLLNIFEDYENVDDYMINKKYAQFVRDEDRIRVELSTSLESNKNVSIKDDNNNDEKDKNKEIDSKTEANGLINSSSEKIENNGKKSDSNNDKLMECEQLITVKSQKSNESDNQDMKNGDLQNDGKKASKDTDFNFVPINDSS